MKLTTEKKLVVFKKINTGNYYCCNRKFFENAYKEHEVIPILYTDNLKVAESTTRKLNEELWA